MEGVEAESPEPGQRKSQPDTSLRCLQKPSGKPDHSFGKRKTFSCFQSV